MILHYNQHLVMISFYQLPIVIFPSLVLNYLYRMHIAVIIFHRLTLLLNA